MGVFGVFTVTGCRMPRQNAAVKLAWGNIDIGKFE